MDCPLADFDVAVSSNAPAGVGSRNDAKTLFSEFVVYPLRVAAHSLQRSRSK